MSDRLTERLAYVTPQASEICGLPVGYDLIMSAEGTADAVVTRLDPGIAKVEAKTMANPDDGRLDEAGVVTLMRRERWMPASAIEGKRSDAAETLPHIDFEAAQLMLLEDVFGSDVPSRYELAAADTSVRRMAESLEMGFGLPVKLEGRAPAGHSSSPLLGSTPVGARAVVAAMAADALEVDMARLAHFAARVADRHPEPGETMEYAEEVRCRDCRDRRGHDVRVEVAVEALDGGGYEVTVRPGGEMDLRGEVAYTPEGQLSDTRDYSFFVNHALKLGEAVRQAATNLCVCEMVPHLDPTLVDGRKVPSDGRVTWALEGDAVAQVVEAALAGSNPLRDGGKGDLGAERGHEEPIKEEDKDI